MVMVALASLHVLVEVDSLVTVDRDISATDIARPLYEAIHRNGIDSVSESEMETVLEPIVATFTEAELSSMLSAIESDEEITEKMWKSMWRKANKDATHAMETSGTLREVVPTIPHSQRKSCSPVDIWHIISGICQDDFLCIVFFYLIENIVEYLKDAGLMPTQAGGCGDPHMFGFDGSSFLFIGDLDHTFNILSDKDFTFHTQLMEAGAKNRMYFGSFEIIVQGVSVIVKASNDAARGLATGKELLPSCFRISTSPFSFVIRVRRFSSPFL